MLPGRDGFSVVTELRARGVFTPVLLLTARDELEARVRGLEGGADDYLTKPFDLPELLARVHALIRRAELRHKDATRSEEHTSELQSQSNLVCRLLLEKKKKYSCVATAYGTHTAS